MVQNSTENEKRFDYLWLVLFLIVFINGFEAGGYQASLWNIGQNYDLSVTSMGLFASVELFATMLAPLVLGAWADRNSKAFCMKILLALEFAAAIIVFVTHSEIFFVVCVFFLGLTTSALQFISIAALADAYPKSGSRKIGFITSMYAFGALVSPLVVSFYLNYNLSWRTLFALLAIGSLVAIVGIINSGDKPREQSVLEVTNDSAGGRTSEFFLPAILLLCVIMLIYVGFENGFTFFVDTIFTDVLGSGLGKYALSVFWAVMIPSRVLVGYFAKKAKGILITATLAIPVITFILSFMENSLIFFILCIPLGFACGAIYPSVLNMMLPFAGKKTATATGMITTATGIGGFLFTALTGFVGDNFGMRIAMRVLAAIFLLTFISAVCTTRMKRKS
nr:MFS transporter [uncultured Butyrivibrio sp.]